MDDAVLIALQRWPNVPACYGWIHLDPRGQWRLGTDGGERVRHAGLASFLARNYARNDRGEWFVQNGPQRAYVTLARTPFIIHVDGEGHLHTHTQQAVSALTNARIGQDGNLYLTSEFGLSILDDRDLPGLLGKIIGADGNRAEDSALQALIDGHETSPLFLAIGNQKLPCSRLDSHALGPMFGFVDRPSPEQ